ncbi:MAG: hypothetical protein ACTTJZ_00450 [Sphaerochaetaceae bacterium]
MKKLFLLFVAISAIFCLAGCRDEAFIRAGDPVLKNIDFKAYDAFAVMKESSGSKSLSDSISSTLNRLFGLADNSLEKITIADEKGLEWACDSVKNVGNDYILMELSNLSESELRFKNYCVDRASNKIIDLSFLIGDRKIDSKELGLQSTAEGLFAKNSGSVAKIDTEAKTATPLTNSNADGVIAYYRDDNGNMLVYTSKGNFKLFPANSAAPIDYSTMDGSSGLFLDGVRDKDPMYMIANNEFDAIVCLREYKVFHIASGALVSEKLSIDDGGSLSYYYGACLSDESRATVGQKVIWYSALGYVTIHDLSSGALSFIKYDAPENLATSYLDKGNVAYYDGNLIYSSASGLFSLNLESQVTTPVFEGSVSSWKLAPGGLIYTKYLTATDTQTCFYNFATKETEVLSSSGVEVVSIANFVE